MNPHPHSHSFNIMKTTSKYHSVYVCFYVYVRYYVFLNNFKIELSSSFYYDLPSV